jgi:hypothetical protein
MQPAHRLTQAFLSRAVQLVADFTRAHASIPEAAVAQALRGRGVSLQQLQARAQEVQRGIAECASDEGWRLIQVWGRVVLHQC